ncbi:hypothetical protein [Streptomyces hydrogenans]|uniref:hypothetical protein n=1 Tax=Streptomyces hydrogenans TaxID=1873719 RepID=UPI003811CACA
MNALLDTALSTDQRGLLLVIAKSWSDTGQWPQWGYLQHACDRNDLDAETLLRSLPRVGMNTHYAAGYGYTSALSHHPSETDTIRLTIAAGLALTNAADNISKPFLQVLKRMIKIYLTTSPAQSGITPQPTLSSQDLRRAIDLTTDEPGPKYTNRFIAALPELLSYEPGIATGNRTTQSPTDWKLEITRSVLKYRNVSHLVEYVATTCDIVEAAAAQHAPGGRVRVTGSESFITGYTGRVLVPTSDGQFGSFDETGLWDPTPVPSPASPADTRPPYLDDSLLTQIETAAPNTHWKVDKLLALCSELNDSYAAGHAYACAALIRAVLDHIPPVFGHRDFKQVAAQHTFTVQRTDKAHAQKLAGFKDIADDALHRPISTNIPLITMNDIPEPARLRALLHELVTLMRKAPATTA